MHKMSLALPTVIVDDIRSVAVQRGYSAAEVTRQAIVLGLSALRVPGMGPKAAQEKDAENDR